MFNWKPTDGHVLCHIYAKLFISQHRAYPMFNRKRRGAKYEKSVLMENSQWINKTQNNIVCNYMFPDLYGTNCEHKDEIAGFTLITIKYFSTQ